VIAASLRKIEQDLAKLAAEATAENPIDPFAIAVIARKVEAQAEMLEEGLHP
jgi:hypothetical protein